MRITFQKNGLTKNTKAGFSWTVLFFGPLCLLLRGMLAWAIVTAIVNVMSCGLWQVVFAFMANRKYAQHLAERGWSVVSSDAAAASAAWGFVNHAEGAK